MTFTKEDSNFFRPLTSKNARLYFECAARLVEKSKEMPVLYERDAREIIAFHIKQLQYQLEDEGMEEECGHIGKDAMPAQNAGAVLARFRQCGWAQKREIGRGGEDLTVLTSRCRKLISAVGRIFHPGTGISATNHIFSMHEILYSALELKSGRQSRPYSSILEPLTDHEADLKEELYLLRDGIRGVMDGILKQDNANGLGSYMVKDEFLNRFFKDYFFMKKDGTVPGIVAQINVLLSRLSASELYPRIIAEYAASKEVARETAEAAVEAQFAELEYFLNHGYDEQMSVIDDKIVSYYNLYAARLSMARSGGMDTRGYLGRILEALKGMDAEEREEALSGLSGTMRVMSFKLAGPKSFERRKQAGKEKKEQGGIVDVHVGEEELSGLTKALYGASSERYGIDAARRHIREKLNGKESFRVADEADITKEEALLVASAVVFSSTEDFPYQADFGEAVTDHGGVEMSDFVLAPKPAKKTSDAGTDRRRGGIGNGGY